MPRPRSTPRLRRPTPTRALALLLTALTGSTPGCGDPEGAARLDADATNLLLVTLDTTRADRLGSYGHAAARTPVLDRLAAEGTLFERAFAPVPMTLPSHCSLMTGLYPREHGLRDNGHAALSQGVPTLAAVFAERGHRTGAFVSAFVLDSRYGLDRGFERYDDRLATPRQGEMQEAERTADRVTDAALAWLREEDERPFFCWVHYFDAHDPYEPPEDFRGGDLYDGELAFLDRELGRIVAELEASGRYERTLVVVAGDHGESLGEHGYHGHTVFVYETHLHVPLLFRGTPAVPAGHQVASTVELIDVAPTILALFGWEASGEVSGRSLVPALRGEMLEPRAAYGENIYSTIAFGWAQQHSLRDERWKYISSAVPELYDLAADPGETRNVIDEHPEVASRLAAALEERHGSMRAGDTSSLVPDAETLEALESLGYAGGGSSAGAADELLSPGLPDVKERFGAVVRRKRAKALAASGSLAEATAEFEELVRESPGSTLFRYELGLCQLDAGRLDAARATLTRVLEEDPAYLPAQIAMAEALIASDRREEAVVHLQAALSLVDGSPDLHASLASELLRLGRRDEAASHFARALELRPGWRPVLDDLVGLLEAADRTEAALPHYERWLAHAGEASDDVAARYARTLFATLGDEGALARLRTADLPGGVPLSVGLALARSGAPDRATPFFELASEDDASAPDAFSFLAVTAARAGDHARASGLYERALAVDPAHPRASEALSTQMSREGRPQDALALLQRAHGADPASAPIANLLARLLATCRDPGLRDGARALELARSACAASGRRNPAFLSTLAAALAETGALPEAVATVDEAIALAPPQAVAGLRAEHERYVAGEALRLP